MTKKENKNVALFIAFYYSCGYDQSKGSVWNTFDEVYQMGIEFVEKFPPSLTWENGSFEEVMDKFINEKQK